jgi:hypothetical protein
LTNDPYLVNVQIAKLINTHAGGAVIAPWDVDELPDVWIDTFMMLSKLPEMRKAQKTIENAFERHAAKHPHYRKH